MTERKRRPPAGAKPRKAKLALAIDLVDGHILVAILNPARFVNRVMWLMQDIKAGEILISQAALEAIQTAQPRPGIVPMDIGSVDRALGLASWKFSAQYLSVQPGAAQWLGECVVVKDTEARAAVSEWATKKNAVLAKIKKDKILAKIEKGG